MGISYMHCLSILVINVINDLDRSGSTGMCCSPVHAPL